METNVSRRRRRRRQRFGRRTLKRSSVNIRRRFDFVVFNWTGPRDIEKKKRPSRTSCARFPDLFVAFVKFRYEKLSDAVYGQVVGWGTSNVKCQLRNDSSHRFSTDETVVIRSGINKYGIRRVSQRTDKNIARTCLKSRSTRTISIIVIHGVKRRDSFGKT